MDVHFERGKDTTNEWYTPKWILDALGEFDIDPCAPEKPLYRTAKVMIDKNTDGLLTPWLGGGRIWLNPPYSHPIIDYFMEKMALHNNGIALLFNRMDTDMWQDLILPHASALLVIRGRVRFLRPDGTEPKANPGCGSVLVAYGEQNAETLKHCNIKGTFIKL